MKLNSGFILLFFCILALPVFLPGQNDPLLRIEIDTKSDDATYKIANCGDQGFVMFYETTITQDNYKFWVYLFHNKFMQEVWKKDIPVYDNMKYRRQILKDDYLYILYHDIDKKKSESYNYQILKLNIAKGRYELFSGNIPDNARFSDFEIFEDLVIGALDLDDDQSAIYSLNMTSRETKPVFEMQIDKSKIKGLYIDTLHNSYFGIFNVRTSKSEYYFLLKEFDVNGNDLNSILILPDANKKLNSGKLVTINENEKLLIGTYDVVKGSSIDKKNYFDSESSGFYSIKIKDNRQADSYYYNFLDLENMTGYLKSNEYHQARKKASKKDNSKEELSVGFDLLIHDIVQKDSLYYFVAEAYYEEYHTVTSTYYDYYGHPVPVSYSVFDGFRYFNAFISCINKDGIKIWDNGMEIFNILTYDLKKRVNVYLSDEDILMAYNREGKIAAKIINGTDVIEGMEYFPLESTYTKDKIMEDTKSSMEYWYDNYFLAYGFQTIRNNSLVNRSKRVVFYINKVAFE
ncbi:MAG: hypothetical protein K8R86_12210 [Bacteroidales bacterium]|nr:hypothetical protein [Bacteroidales bacterium]